MTDGLSPSTPPEEHDAPTDGTLQVQSKPNSNVIDSDVLLIKECNPWETQANEEILYELDISYNRVDSEAVSGIDFTDYSAVILPSTQPQQFYDALAEAKDDIVSFVENGGTLVAHVAETGWPCNTFEQENTYLPNDVEVHADWTSDGTLLKPDHPIMDDIEESNLGEEYEFQAAHFENVPEDATILVRDDVHDKPSYIEYQKGSGTVIATGQSIEWPWQAINQYGVNTKELLRNELKYAVGLSETSVTGSLTTLQFIPGGDENHTEGGDSLNSGLMQIFPEGADFVPADDVVPGFGYVADGLDSAIPTDPVIDAWIGGDMRESLPSELSEARQKKQGKYLSDIGPDQRFQEYRMENGVTISFQTTSDGGVDRQTIEVQFHESNSASPTESAISFGDQDPSQTVLHDGSEHALPLDEFFDGDNQTASKRERRHYAYDPTFEFDGVEGVRVTTIWGGWVGFMEEIAEKISEDPAGTLADIWGWGSVLGGLADGFDEILDLAPAEVQALVDYLSIVPRTWSFIDLIVLADGRRYGRVWDATAYPSLYTYMDGQLRDEYNLWYETNQLVNPGMSVFLARAMSGLTPYNDSGLRYERFLRLGKDSRDYNELKRSYDDILDQLASDATDFAVDPIDDFLLRLPITMGYDENGESLNDPDGPFPSIGNVDVPFTGFCEYYDCGRYEPR